MVLKVSENYGLRMIPRALTFLVGQTTFRPILDWHLMSVDTVANFFPTHRLGDTKTIVRVDFLT